MHFHSAASNLFCWRMTCVSMQTVSTSAVNLQGCLIFIKLFLWLRSAGAQLYRLDAHRFVCTTLITYISFTLTHRLRRLLSLVAKMHLSACEPCTRANASVEPIVMAETKNSSGKPKRVKWIFWIFHLNWQRPKIASN